VEGGGDLPVGQALGEAREDRLLAVGQRGRAGSVRGGRRRRVVAAEQRGPDGRDHLGRRGLRAEHAVGAAVGADGGPPAARAQDDGDRGVGRAQPQDGLAGERAAVGDVEHRDVWPVGGARGRPRRAIGGDEAAGDPGLAAQQQRGAQPAGLVGVDDERDGRSGRQGVGARSGTHEQMGLPD
jgi:hypothetical protein